MIYTKDEIMKYKNKEKNIKRNREEYNYELCYRESQRNNIDLRNSIYRNACKGIDHKVLYEIQKLTSMRSDIIEFFSFELREIQDNFLAHKKY